MAILRLTRQSMCLAVWVGLANLATSIAEPVRAQSADDDLKVYAVSITNAVPFKRPFSGFGIYLGRGTFITAAHVVGRWSIFSDPRIEIAGQEVPAKVVKKGSFEKTDLALLAVDEKLLPVSLLLRLNPLCKTPPAIGSTVVVVYPERTVRSYIISPKLVSPDYRARFGSIIKEVQGSGSGVFDAERKCLIGIMSAAVSTNDYRGHSVRAGNFVPASQIAAFIPAGSRF
jgi:S1-C subfamily serine protease